MFLYFLTEAFLFMLPSGDLDLRALPNGVLRTEAIGVTGRNPPAAFSLLKVDLGARAELRGVGQNRTEY